MWSLVDYPNLLVCWSLVSGDYEVVRSNLIAISLIFLWNLKPSYIVANLQSGFNAADSRSKVQSISILTSSKGKAF